MKEICIHYQLETAAILAECASIDYDPSKAITAPLPNKTLVMETKSKIIKQSKSAVLQKSKNIDEKTHAKTNEKDYYRGDGKRCI